MVSDHPWGRRETDHQKVRPFIDRWGVYLAMAFVLAFTAAGFLQQQRIIDEQTHARIVQCERGNTTSLSLRALANDLGASSAQIRLVAKRFPILDCRHPTSIPTTTTTMHKAP